MQHISLFLGVIENSIKSRENIIETIQIVLKETAGLSVPNDHVVFKGNSIDIQMSPIEKSVALEYLEKIEENLVERIGKKEKIRFLK